MSGVQSVLHVILEEASSHGQFIRPYAKGA